MTVFVFQMAPKTFYLLLLFMILNSQVEGKVKLSHWTQNSIILNQFHKYLLDILSKPQYLNLRNCKLLIKELYASKLGSCLIQNKEDYRQQADKLYALSQFCGSLGFLQNRKVSLQWHIRKLHAELIILVYINYLNLPYFGGTCHYASLTLSDKQKTQQYCGYRKNLLHYFSSDLTVKFVQLTELMAGTGFFVTYNAAYDEQVKVAVEFMIK